MRSKLKYSILVLIICVYKIFLFAPLAFGINDLKQKYTVTNVFDPETKQQDDNLKIKKKSDLEATVNFQVNGPDSTGRGDKHITMTNSEFQLYFHGVTDSTGKLTFEQIPTPVEEEKNPIIAQGYKLEQNYPNPVDNTLTTIRYQVPESGAGKTTTIRIYDVLGKEIKTLVSQQLAPGVYENPWDGTNNFGQKVASGNYFYTLQTDEGLIAKKIQVLENGGGFVGNDVQPNFIGSSIQDNLRKTQSGLFYDVNVTDSSGIFEQLLANEFIHGDTSIIYYLTEIKNITAPGTGVGEEGREVGVGLADFNFASGLDTLLLMNPEVWHVSRVKPDSIFYATNDTTLFGNNVPLDLTAVSNEGSRVDHTIFWALQNMVYWQGQFVDDMKYKKLLNIVEPGAGRRGEIEVEGQGIYTTDNQGNFIIRLPGGGTYTVKAQGKTLSGDPTTFQHTFNQAGDDASGLIFHAMGIENLIAMGLTMQNFYDGYWEGNSAPGPGGNFAGNKTPNWDSSQTSLYPISIFSNDTMYVVEQHYIGDSLDDSIHVHMQKPFFVDFKTISDTGNINGTWGEVLWYKWGAGPAGSIGSQFGNDGILNNSVVSIKAGTPAFLDAILQEGASSIYGPWPINNPAFMGKTLIAETGNPSYFTLVDEMFTRIVENYDSGKKIDNILGGVLVSYMKNPERLLKLQDEVSMIEKITDERRRKFEFRNAMQRFMADIKNSN